MVQKQMENEDIRPYNDKNVFNFTLNIYLHEEERNKERFVGVEFLHALLWIILLKIT